MPRRPESHVKGDSAAHVVAGMFIRAGHAVEHVRNDYGEDLLVQTSHAGQMDATRLWIQVKGTGSQRRFRTKSGWLRVAFPIDQVLRWIRTADAVVVVLWDLEQDEGWFADPRGQVDELHLDGKKTIGLRFQDQHRLDRDAVARLVWSARFRHYSNLCLRAADMEQWQDLAEAELDISPATYSTVPLLAADVLEMIGLVAGDGVSYGVSPDARGFFVSALRRVILDPSLRSLTSDLDDTDPEGLLIGRLYQAATLTILHYARGLSAFGFPISLLEHCCEVLIELLDGYEAVRASLEAVD